MPFIRALSRESCSSPRGGGEKACDQGGQKKPRIRGKVVNLKAMGQMAVRTQGGAPRVDKESKMQSQ